MPISAGRSDCCCCTHLLVLVTPRELGGGSGQDAAIVREEVARHRSRAVLLDWVSYSAGHGDWFQPDGIHLTTAGAIAFTHLLARALPSAYPVTWKRSAGGDPEFPHRWAQSTGGDPHLSATQAAAPALRLRTSLTHVGYVGVAISGPAGAQVRLSERHAGREQTIATVTLTSKPTQLPHALAWRCDRRDRDLIARTLPSTTHGPVPVPTPTPTPTPTPMPMPVLSATATVHTPSCAGRLVARIDPKARVGHHLTIRLRDRWTLGNLRLRICLAPPGARAGVPAVVAARRHRPAHRSPLHAPTGRLARERTRCVRHQPGAARLGRARERAAPDVRRRRLRDADP